MKPGNTITKNKLVILYGVALAAILFLMKWLELRFVIMDHSFEIYIGAIALIFTSLGIWLALKIARPKKETIIVEKPVYVTPLAGRIIPDEKAMISLGISKREWEVLNLMSVGLSNQEIADRLFR